MQVARHWREIPRRYRLEAGKCKGCKAVSFPSRLICPDCGKREFDTVTLSGKGKLTTWTVTRVAADGFGDLAPYAVGIIELDEGVKVMAQIADCEVDKLKTGDRMVTQFRKVRQEGKAGILMYGYKFVPDVGL